MIIAITRVVSWILSADALVMLHLVMFGAAECWMLLGLMMPLFWVDEGCWVDESRILLSG